MSTTSNLWCELAESKKYREAFATLQLKRGVPFQIRSLLKERNWKQEELAEMAGVSQGVISRAQDPDYGNLTINTIARIAAGFDVAFIGKFVPFGDLVEWFENLSEDSGQVESFEKEYANRQKRKLRVIRKKRRGRVRKIAGNGSMQQPSVGQMQLSLFESSNTKTTAAETISAGIGNVVQMPRKQQRPVNSQSAAGFSQLGGIISASQGR
jgi:transcriptional regulator with XRE-family HTH domain